MSQRNHTPLNFPRFLAVPENRSALVAVQTLGDDLRLHHKKAPWLIYMHGPAGTGKSYLLQNLCEQVVRHVPTMIITNLAARELDFSADDTQAARSSDLTIVEDLQFLHAAKSESFVTWLDDLLARHIHVVVTASTGPSQLQLPGRVTSRLASGLVVGIEPLRTESRLSLLEDKAQRRQLAIHRNVLLCLARRLTGGIRQLDGAITRLETLTRQRKRAPDVSWIDECFADDAGEKLSTETIAQRVGQFFRVDQKHLRSADRGRKILLPRQLSMYLTRQHTTLSLEQIGSYFGRDHTTVLHACRKVEDMMKRDSYFTGMVRQLSAEMLL